MFWGAWGTNSRLKNETRLDFFHFYEAAKALTEGEDLYDSGSGGYIYPPLVAVAFQPLARLDYPAAVWVWFSLNTALVLGALILGLKVLGERLGCPPSTAAQMVIASVAVVLTSEQIRWHLILGQTDTITLFGCVLGLFLIDRRPWLAGLVLGSLVAVKYQALIFLPYLLIRGRWSGSIAYVLGGITALFGPAVILGWEQNLSYLTVAFGGILEMAGVSVERAAAVPILTWDRSITITSGLARIMEANGHSTNWAIGLAGGLGAVIAGMTALLYGRCKLPFLFARGGAQEKQSPGTRLTLVEWTGLLIALCAFSPQATKRHLYLLLFVHLVVCYLWWQAKVPGTRWFLVVGIILSQAALRLPPTPMFSDAAEVWNFIGGPSWGLIIWCFAVVWAMLKEIQRLEAEPLSRPSAPASPAIA